MDLSVKQVCSLLDITEPTLYEWINENKIRRFVKNSKNYFDQKEILKMRPTTVTLFNQKGGVAKTTLAWLLADYFDHKKEAKKILLCDFDQQANLTKHFISEDILYDEANPIPTLSDYFSKKLKLNDIIFEHNEVIDILPARIELSNVPDIDSKILEVTHARDFNNLFRKYNLVIIDCPPSLGMMSKFGVILANYIFCPVLLDPASYWGLGDAINAIKTYRVNERFIDFKVIINVNTRMSAIKDSYKSRYFEEIPNNMLNNVLPEFVGFSERGVYRENIFNRYNEKDNISKIMPLMNEICEVMYEKRPIHE